MSFDAVVQQVFTNTSAYFLKTLNRMKAARTALQANAYTADKLAADVAGFWFDTADAWADAYPLVGSPLLPTVFIAAPAGNTTVTSKGSAFVSFSVPDGPVKVTDLVGTGTISGALTAKVATGQLSVEMKLSTAASPGSYQSLAFLAANSPVAMIFVQLT